MKSKDKVVEKLGQQVTDFFGKTVKIVIIM